MACATNIHSPQARAADRLAAWWDTLQEAINRRLMMRRTVRELNQLSDRELSDLGIARYEIRRIAWHAAYGK
ncbi:MAG: hypothetical protein CSA73_00395 [Rhodobacterales bacterium]|nr:MAG: hypothetical protein CR964_00690 [Rhodobacterales bacterium]PIE09082.1 MAG: hypothetical protein CSA73_00395 [Rhodobacterales bacterium]